MAFKVVFAASEKTAQWDDSHQSLLELARANGIEIETECGPRNIISLDSARIEPMESNEHKTLITIPEGYVRVAEPYDSIRQRINEAGLLIGLMPKEGSDFSRLRRTGIDNMRHYYCPTCGRTTG